MTPQMKSQELIMKYKSLVDSYAYKRNILEYSKNEETKNAARCAIIAVREILTVLQSPTGVSHIAVYEFWKEVKNELHKHAI